MNTKRLIKELRLLSDSQETIAESSLILLGAERLEDMQKALERISGTANEAKGNKRHVEYR